MESIQQLLADLFGGDVSFFSSLWDIVQGFLLVGGGIVAMIYRSRDTLSRAIAKVKTGEVDKLTQEIVTVKKGVDLEVKELKEVVTYMADMLVTLSLASPVLLDKAKQQIAGYAHEIKKISHVELEPVTLKIIEAINKTTEPKVVLAKAEAVIEQKAEAIQKEVKATEASVTDIINSIKL
jgi:hypothetical protein